MKVGKIVKIAGALTFLALCYIHLQVKIVDLAYQGKNREKYMKDLAEQNGHLTYTITMLKSARNLGSKMLNEHSEMRFASPQQIVRIPSVETVAQNSPADSRKAGGIDGLLSFLPQMPKSGMRPR